MKNMNRKGAIIEIGTNSVKFLTASVKGFNTIEIYRNDRQITRSGEGLEETGVLSAGAMERTIGAVKDYTKIARSDGFEDIVVFGTYSLRRAGNSGDFINSIKAETGVETRILSGQQEAFMTRKGVLLNHPGKSGKEHVIIDIGGGSTEVVYGSWAGSLPVGCVNMTEEMITDDPPCKEGIIRINSRVRDLLISNISFLNPGQKNSFVGVGGTVVTVAALSLGLTEYDPDRIHGTVINPEDLRFQLEKLCCVKLRERREILCFDRKRADVIIAGMAILNSFFKYFSMDNLRVSVLNIIHGMFYDCFAGEDIRGVSNEFSF